MGAHRDEMHNLHADYKDVNPWAVRCGSTGSERRRTGRSPASAARSPQAPGRTI